MKTDEYFERLEEQTEKAYDIAEEARDQNRDPEPRVDIPVAKDLPQKASSLVIAAKFPELEDRGIADRIRELEQEYGKNDERVSFEIAREIAEGEFHEFEDLERACDAGIRVGVSYMTGGITTAPLEGIGDIRIRENPDGSRYLAVYYSGPIRSAGGTASAMSVLLADYVRKSVGLEEFDPPEQVVERYATEVDDYYNRVTAKQYYPDRRETEMISSNVPVEVTGSPTEQKEVSNHKDLDLVDTNRIRGGMCLVYLDGLPLKAPKIKKRIESWGDEFGLEHWNWIKDYLELQEEIHSSGEESGDEDSGYTPSEKYLGSLTAGRPVLGHPGRKGGFRLRYGHSRTNGLAAVSFHPATMEVTDRFLSIGTQLKIEYPGKATVGTVCEKIHPPVVRMKDGSVRKMESREEVRENRHGIEEILFLGDMLVTYGEFVENGKRLLPSPYVEEWWQKDLEKALEDKDVRLGKDFSDKIPSPDEALKISRRLEIPLHPRWTYHWDETTLDRFQALVEGVEEGDLEGQEIRKCLEDILVEFELDNGVISLEEEDRKIIDTLLSEIDTSGLEAPEDIPEAIERNSGIELGDQAPHYLGSRMGRPEKAEKRTLEGRPQLLFPCGREEGGRMRNIAESYRKETVDQQIIHNYCSSCEEYSYFSYCTSCGEATEERWFCSSCDKEYGEEQDKCGSCGSDRFNRYRRTDIEVRELIDQALENVGERLPELLKSPRGMSGEHRHVEPIEKGILRQKHGLYVNKDGTVRYDATDLPMTHFTPEEISVPIDRLRELGYTEDVDGEPLESEDQVLALKPQDIIIPDTDKSLPASDYLVDVAKFVDELLEKFYDLEPYYNVEKKEDLVGELVIGLAPHTSGGTVGRIIGFTDAKGVYAHPYWHAGKRRNCLPGDTEVQMADGSTKSLRQLFEAAEGESREVDTVGTVEKDIDVEVKSISEEEVVSSKCSKVMKTPAQDTLIKFETETGRQVAAYPDHKLLTSKGKQNARRIGKGENLRVIDEGKPTTERVRERVIVQSRDEKMYDIEVEKTHRFVTGEGVAVSNCDGDEDAILLLMDGLLNFSRQFLPDMTGARSVTRDTRIFVRRDGEFLAPTARELVDGILETEGYETRPDGFEVCRDFDENIEAVSFDDNGDVEFEEVSALIRHRNDKKVFNVNTSRGEISVTGDHSVFVTRGGDIEARPVRELEEGDCIVVPSNPDLEAEGLSEEIDVFEVLPSEECYVEIEDEERRELKPELEQEIGESVEEKYGNHNIYRYLTGRRSAPLSFYEDAGVVPSCRARLKADSQPIDRYFRDSEELYRLLGYLLSEGSLDRGEIHNTDRELIRDAVDCIRELTGVEPAIKEDRREGRKVCYYIQTPETFMRVLEELGLERNKFDSKKVPSFVFGASDENLRNFIEAYRDGDGSVYEEKGFSKLYTKSGEMASQLSLITRKLGYKSSTRKAEETWQVLYSEWKKTNPYWPLWDILDEAREALRNDGNDYEAIKKEFSNDRKNDRMKTASKKRVEELYSKGVESLSRPVEGDIAVERVKEIEKVDYGDDYVYDLEVPGKQNFLCGPHPVFAHNTMDAPLILSTVLNPDEVDDEAWAIETVDEYPLSFYEESLEYPYPWELETDIEIGEDVVHSDDPFRHAFTHDSRDIENGPTQSEYVTLDEMSEKTSVQLELGERIKAVDEDETAGLLLQKHFIPDIKGNLRSFSEQEMRCNDCNTKFRRVPMTSQTIAPTGKTTAECPECGGKILLTISEGTIKKYLEPSRDIIERYEVSPYIRQQIMILKDTLQSLFGKDDRQSGLKQFTA